MIPIAVRRLHDTGRSGWWLVATYALTTAYVVSIMGAVVAAMGDPDKMMETVIRLYNPFGWGGGWAKGGGGGGWVLGL